MTPDRLQTLTSLTRAQITRSSWRPDDTRVTEPTCAHAWFICVDCVRDLIIIHVSLSNRSCTYKMHFCVCSPTVIRFTMKRLNRTYSRSQWLIVIPVHCGSAVADPSGLTPRLEESQLQGPQWIYSHYNNCKYLSFMSSLHLNEPFHAVVSMQQLVWPSDAGMTRCWQTCVTVVKRVSYPAHQTRGQSWDC